MWLRYVQSVVKRSCISITNVLSVSAYNTITTKPVVKKFCWKNKCHFLPKQKAESHINFCTLCVLVTQTRRSSTPTAPPPLSTHMCHSQIFDKIDSFQILWNLAIGWGEGVIKKGAGILHQIYRFREGV